MCDRKLYYFVFLSLVCDISQAQNFCAKIDFNRPTYSEFHECHGRYIPKFVIKPYWEQHEIHPYRSTSQYFLGTDFYPDSCIESVQNFSMNANTRIEAAIYLKSFSNAFIEIIVLDADNNSQVHNWRNGTANGNWFVIHGEVQKNIPHAQVLIHAFMNAQSSVAIEYIHVLNKAVNLPDCVSIEPTKPPPPRPGSPNVDQNWWWILIVVLVSIILVMIICIGIYCLVENRRQGRSHDCTAK